MTAPIVFNQFFTKQVNNQTMKNSALIFLIGVLCIALITSCAKPAYLGKSYAPTQHVDVYLDRADVRRSYTSMGTSTLDQDFRSLDGMQQKLIETGQAKGADGVIMNLSEEVALTQQNGTGRVNKNNKDNSVSTTRTTVDIKKKKITATFIKYD